MATIKFEVLGKSEITPIYLKLSVKRGITPRAKTGLNINPKEWSDKTKLPKQTNGNNKNLTSDLRGLTNSVLTRCNTALKDGEIIDKKWLEFVIDLHFGRTNEHKQSDLVIDAISTLIENAPTRRNSKGGIGLSKSRINTYEGLKRLFSEYQKTHLNKKNQHYKVKDVNVKFANDFLKWLLKTKGYQNSYATKKIADLKTVCFDAETYGVEVHHQLKKIHSAKTSNENIVYLSKHELQKIERAKLNTDAQENVRKWLLLGCNIGQRGNDLLNIDESNFITRAGLSVIELKQQKTDKNVTIPILPTTKKILENGLPYKLSIQNFNDHVKEVCRLAGITEMIQGSKIQMVDENNNVIAKDKKGNYISKGFKRAIDGIYPKNELIGSHVCRRSFATNLYGELPTALIMRVTAHSTEKMLLNYIGKQGLDYAQQIADFYYLQSQKEKKEPQLTIVKSIVNE
jgi:integrase